MAHISGAELQAGRQHLQLHDRGLRARRGAPEGTGHVRPHGGARLQA